MPRGHRDRRLVVRGLYVTADMIGAQTGGGKVTYHESRAFMSFLAQHNGRTDAWDQTVLMSDGREPWKWDMKGYIMYNFMSPPPKIAHFYSGTFSQMADVLKRHGCPISWTVAAHHRDVSWREHEALGIKYDYPHLTDPELWKEYIRGYLLADVMICPSTHSAQFMKELGCQRVEIVPHGVNIPDRPIRSLPEGFNVGYLGAVGPDKGLIHLLRAWKLLKYESATLVLAGRETQSPFFHHMLISTFPDGIPTNVKVLGWVEDVSSFYESLHVYVQPSVTEGFGLEVLEALAHGRPVLCSTGAGAVDVVYPSWKFESGSPEQLAAAIRFARLCVDSHREDRQWLENCRLRAQEYNWISVQERYMRVWESLL